MPAKPVKAGARKAPRKAKISRAKTMKPSRYGHK